MPYHVHPPRRITALLGRNPKDEAYYFPDGIDMGPHPETYFGVHRSIVEDGQQELLLPYLVDWNSDLILRHAFAFRLVADDGFHVPSGILQAPGTALTVELQEDSDVFAILLITHERAVRPLTVTNTGPDDLLILKFFGPDVNPDAPVLRDRAMPAG